MSGGGRRRGAVLALTGVMAAAWFSAGAAPFLRAAASAPAPNDFTPDYVAAHAWLHGGPHGPAAAAVLDGPAGNDYGTSIGAPPVFLLAAYYVHPPTAFLTLMPLVPLGYGGAALGWLLLSVASLGALTALLLSAAGRGVDGRATTALFTLLLLWPPMLTNIQRGQWSIFLAAAIAAGYAAWDEGRHRRGAAWIGLAVALKLTPILLLPFVALRDRRATLTLFGTLAIAAALSLAAGQLEAWRAFFRHSAENVGIWQTHHDNTLSIGGLLARLLVGGRFARPLVEAPMLARLLRLGCLATLGGTALWLTRTRAGQPPDRVRDGCCFALWIIVIVVANPLAWAHYALLLLLPVALVLRRADQAAPDEALWMRRLAAIALCTLTIPKETLYRLAGPVPVAPGRGLFISTHLAGALILFVGAALGARNKTRRGREPSDEMLGEPRNPVRRAPLRGVVDGDQR